MSKINELIEPFDKFWKFLLVNLVIGTVFCTITFDQMFASVTNFTIGVIWSTAIFMSQWLGHSYIQTQIAKKYSWIDKTFQRMALTIISIVVYSVSAFLAVQIIMNLIVFQEVPDYLLNPNFKMLRLPVIISFFVSLIAAAYGFFVSWKASIVEQETLKREMLSYKYEALRNQINPHFMFNSLNVLSDLVYDDQKLAVNFIHQFSDIYRYVLDSREKELVPLEEELDFIEKFIFLLKTRFENKFEVDLDIQVENKDLIVPLALQLLIENAVKHNEVSSANPLKISITRSGNYIVVSNPIKLKKTGDDSKKIGLKNLQQQFSYFTDKELTISTQNNLFTVTLPILKEA